MELTLTQLQTLRDFVNVNFDAVYEQSTVDALNMAANPVFSVYRSDVNEDEVMLNGFDWVRVDNLSVGKARIWEWMFGVTGSIDPSKANIRAGINEVWKGTAADLAVRDAVYAHCYRPATVFEKMFATGAGTTPDNSGVGPGTMAIEGQVTLPILIEAASS